MELKSITETNMMFLALILFGGLSYLCIKAYLNLKKLKAIDSQEVKKRKKNAIIFGCIGLFGTWVCLGDVRHTISDYLRSNNNIEYHYTNPSAPQQSNVEKTTPVKITPTYASDGLKCTQCIGHYQGGFCDICGAASPERVQESYSKAANCKYCQGSGVIPNGNRYKVCPSCRGTGKQTY